MAEILDQVGDWELAKAVGLPTSLPEPLPWTRASLTDYALLTGYLPLLIVPVNQRFGLQLPLVQRSSFASPISTY
jgi:hypothetical protein